ncbi:MAG: membrane dipeptidase, partial [Clostridia bacterium]|nr:membrane dipeptidase [Clostridia bacterium]
MKYSIFDTHCDTLCSVLDYGKSIVMNECHVDIERMKKYEQYTQVFACFIDPVYKSCAADRTLNLIDTFHNTVSDKLPDNVRGILSIEGGEGIYSLAHLRNFYRLGVRIIALTWNFSNHIASGALETDETRGLTEFGKLVVAEMNRLGIFADVSHLNDKSFYDVAEYSNKPIIASHSNARAVCRSKAVCPVERNLTDDQFEIIKKSGGCVGINFCPDFLNESGKADIEDIIRHIEHFMSLGGEDNVGIGADFDGIDSTPDGINGVEDIYKIFDRLLQKGYTENQIEKISHKNFERILG